MSNKYAFQCRNCGALEKAEQAGENEVPGACSKCGFGIEYKASGPNFSIVRKPENWIVLADLKPEELAKDFKRHGITHEQVERHTPPKPAEPGRTPKVVSVTAADGVGSKDKAGTK